MVAASQMPPEPPHSTSHVQRHTHSAVVLVWNTRGFELDASSQVGGLAQQEVAPNFPVNMLQVAFRPSSHKQRLTATWGLWWLQRHASQGGVCSHIVPHLPEVAGTDFK